MDTSHSSTLLEHLEQAPDPRSRHGQRFAWGMSLDLLIRQHGHYWRQHWTIENGSHHVRDETLGEDRSQTHVGSAPRVMAALRNGLIALLRHHGWSNIAAALRHCGASPQRALQPIGWPET